MKRLFSRALGCMMACALTLSLTACNTNGEATKPSNSSTTTTSTTAGDKIVLTYWHIWPSGEMADLINEYIAQYEAEHPNIKIEQVATEPAEYAKLKLRVAATTGAQGDIFFTQGGGTARPFIDAQIALPIDQYLDADKTRDRMLDGVMDNFTYDGKAYGLPLKTWASILYCNQSLFEENKIAYPETWEQLLTAVDEFNKLGVSPIAMGAKEPILIALLQNALAVKTAGTDAVNAALNGTGTFETPEIIASAQLMVDLMNRNAFTKGTLGLGAEEASMEFHTGNAAMFVTGSWEALACEGKDSDLNGIVKPMPIPLTSGGKGDATQFLGGVIDCYMINANTKHPQEAFDFAIGMTEFQSRQSYILGDSLPAWKMDVDKSQVNPLLAQIKDLTDGAKSYSLAWDTALTGEAIDKQYNLLQELLGGVVTPDEFAKQLQETNQKVIATHANG